MKSAFLTDITTFDLREVAEPVCPADGVILDVKACGVCGSDLRRWREGPGSEPVVSGHEIGGVVSAVGSAVRGYAVGDKLAVAPDVHCGTCYFCRNGQYNLCDSLHLVGITPGYPGGFSEKMILTGEILANGIVHPIPAGMSF
ncbi:MAG: alcohol dehydrogenase catalytic domain-containing protein, partial [Anaerolineaceae bacterium]|nr:alcohol dehydrogenase catalytic domain-containing protein [Anaerolineaceae bacterium]